MTIINENKKERFKQFLTQKIDFESEFMKSTRHLLEFLYKSDLEIYYKVANNKTYYVLRIRKSNFFMKGHNFRFPLNKENLKPKTCF